MGDRTQFRVTEDNSEQIPVLAAESSADTTKFTVIGADDATKSLKVYFSGADSSITFEIDEGEPITFSVPLDSTSAPVEITFDETKMFIVRKVGDEDARFRFDAADSYVKLEAGASIGFETKCTGAYLDLYPGSSSTTIDIILTIQGA